MILINYIYRYYYKCLTYDAINDYIYGINMNNKYIIEIYEYYILFNDIRNIIITRDKMSYLKSINIDNIKITFYHCVNGKFECIINTNVYNFTFIKSEIEYNKYKILNLINYFFLLIISIIILNISCDGVIRLYPPIILSYKYISYL